MASESTRNENSWIDTGYRGYCNTAMWHLSVKLKKSAKLLAKLHTCCQTTWSDLVEKKQDFTFTSHQVRRLGLQTEMLVMRRHSSEWWLSPGKTRKMVDMVASRGGTTVGQNTWVQDLHCKHIDPLSIKRRICPSYSVAFTILSKGCVACYNHKHVVEKEKARLQYTLIRENNSYTFTDQVIGPVPPWAWGIVLTCRIPCQAAGSVFWYTPDRLISSYIILWNALFLAHLGWCSLSMMHPVCICQTLGQGMTEP